MLYILPSLSFIEFYSCFFPLYEPVTSHVVVEAYPMSITSVYQIVDSSELICDGCWIRYDFGWGHSILYYRNSITVTFLHEHPFPS